MSEISPHAYRAVGCTIAIIGLIGMVTNLTVLLVFCKKRSTLINPSNVFIISLTVSNLAVSIVGNPFSASSNMAQRWLFGDAGCVWYGFANTFFGLVSICNLTSIAIHRYLVICKTDKGAAVTVKLAVIWAIAAWIYAFFWSILPVFGWAHYSYEGLGTWCSIKWDDGSASSISYIVLMFIFCFSIPVIIMIIMYSNIFLKAHSVTQSARHEGMIKVSLKRERRLAKMSLTIWFSFLVAWTPYAVMSIISMIGYSAVVGAWGSILPAVLAKTATIYNPVIYVGMTNAFKVAFIDVFPCTSRFLEPNFNESTASQANDTVKDTHSAAIMTNKVIPSHMHTKEAETLT